MNCALLFPGQGSQSLNMMAGFGNNAIIKETFEEASSVVNLDLWSMITGSDVELINKTIHTQPLMLTAGIAVWRVYRAAGGCLPTVLAGHSLGEYTALVASGSLSFHDAIKLVRLRAELMQHAVPSQVGAMAAILGLDDDAVRNVCLQTEQSLPHCVVEAVNFNAPGQVVVAGHREAVLQAAELAKTAGAKRSLPLPVSVPSHCRLMRHAAEQLAETINHTPFEPPEIPVIHNVDVATHSSPESIRQILIKQLYSPVRWTETIQAIAAQNITLAAECGPGKVLCGLTKRITQLIDCHALIDNTSLEHFLSVVSGS